MEYYEVQKLVQKRTMEEHKEPDEMKVTDIGLPDKNDTPKIIAEKIFYGFVINQAYSVVGYEKDKDDNVEAKGDVVLRILTEIDSKQSMNKHTGERLIRKRKKLPNSIGGYVRQKIFRYKHESFGGKPYVTIWRYQ